MEVTETSAEGLNREFSVTVPADDVESKLSARLGEIGATVTIPGFRPGKVPAALLRKRYGDAVRGEVLEQTINESWQQALTEKGLRPASEPKVEIVTFEEGADLEYKLNVELMPEIEPIDFATLELERKVVNVADEEIDQTLQRLAESRKNFEAISGKRASKEGDQVVIDFQGTVDGEEFAGGSMTDFELELGAGGFLPGFEEQITGMKADENKVVKVSMPDDHPNDQLKGKELTFDVTVKELREAAAVAVDDELAKANGMDNLDALKDAVREELGREYAQLSRAHLKRSLLDKLSDAHNFDLPEGILSGEFDAIWQQVMDAKERDALDEDDKSKSEDELKERYREIASRRVRLGLLISEVGQSNNITVTQDDINKAMQAEAARLPGHEARVFEYYQNNPEAMQELQAPIFEDKVVDFITEMASVKEVETTIEELSRDPDDNAETAEGDKKKKSGSKAKSKSKAAKRAGAKAADKK
ncbi:MAG: trigger factor [Rhodospirillaceae bacterium]|nr:trigger factor [Rhodospirillaceae bacterium]|tara:strand:+ start:5774 stop:7201 length:1428 start_codon:yes stop_codon:yes gene_type:complete